MVIISYIAVKGCRKPHKRLLTILRNLVPSCYKVEALNLTCIPFPASFQAEKKNPRLILCTSYASYLKGYFCKSETLYKERAAFVNLLWSYNLHAPYSPTS